MNVGLLIPIDDILNISVFTGWFYGTKRNVYDY